VSVRFNFAIAARAASGVILKPLRKCSFEVLVPPRIRSNTGHPEVLAVNPGVVCSVGAAGNIRYRGARVEHVGDF
jgi:hypothetical protein